MFHSISHSLLLRIALIMVALTLLAVSSMVTSVFIGRTIQGEASAVNLAGSLRMQSYRIATQLLSADKVDARTHWQRMQGLLQNFEGRLYSSGLTDIVPTDPNHDVRLGYERVKRAWDDEIRPLLDDYVNGIIPSARKPASAPKTWGMISNSTVTSLRTRYLANVPKFVDHIDHLVASLSNDAEAKVRWLRTYQWIALFLTLGILLLALIFTKRKVVTPLRHLLISANATGRGDFSIRTPYVGQDELGRMGFAFNQMAAKLSKLYLDLEERVRIKTKDLEESNRSLDVLYKTVNRLSGKPLPHVTYQGLLEEITMLAGTGPAVICLKGSEESKAHELATTRDLDDSLITCKTTDCQTCFGRGKNNGRTHFFDHPTNDSSAHPVISLAIKDARHHHGVLLVEARDHKGFADWQKRVLEAVASHIGMAIAMSGLHAEQNRLALLTERGAIARELHDSLAQSLSYAKIQVSRLNHVLGSSPLQSEAREINDELRDGLNRAYRELRELLTTFRLTMDDQDLVRTIRDTVEEFAGRGSVQIQFTGDCPNGLLVPNEEIHLLQIVREALSNVVRHSKATDAKVVLRYCKTGEIELEIEDDGCGMDHDNTDLNRQHYGLVIMRERALSLNGELKFECPVDQGGTRVTLSFVPLAQRPITRAEPLLKNSTIATSKAAAP
jgi:two-component system, NarL family, nitrate/nitrite sensor histidine kinase NarX